MTKKATTFRTECLVTADAAEVEVEFYDDDRPDDEFEDDGYLHVRRSGLRAVFDVSSGQADSGFEQNTKTRTVLERLGISVSASNQARVMVEEDDDACPHCGRPF